MLGRLTLCATAGSSRAIVATSHAQWPFRPRSGRPQSLVRWNKQRPPLGSRAKTGIHCRALKLPALNFQTGRPRRSIQPEAGQVLSARDSL